MKQDKEYIIELKNVYKRYGDKNVILRGFDMKVEKGIIYGLLGPSGCGKTTLLSCVCGLLRADSGHIHVDLTSRGQLGYMPQDIALVDLFNVSEMFQYFGKLNGLSSSRIEEKGNELLHLVELPPEKFWKKTINTLSGGQQRRISLTIALLHEPSLLIMDEPTVGLDPLLSNKLWNFFSEISKNNGVTLIITTHYIEEARQANMIGLMRNGVLLTEDSPLKLLETHECDTLEDVFLLLSHKQSIISIDNDEPYPNPSPTKPPFNDGSTWDRKRMEAQIYKNACWMRRNIPVMLFMLLLPTVLMLLFCTVYSDYLRGVRVAVVSEEMLPGTCSHPPATPPPRQCRPDSRLSCKFLPLLLEKSDYELVEYKSLEEGKQSVLDGEARVLLHFEKQYSWALIRRLDNPIITPDRYVNASLMKVYLNMADMIIGFKLRRDIMQSFDEFVINVHKECKYNVRTAGSVLKFETPVFGSAAPRFIDSAIPGFIIPLVFYFTTVFSSSAVVSEKSSGFLDRCLIAGVHHNEIIFAIAVTQILLVIGQNALLLIIPYGVYQVPLQGSWFLILTFLALADVQGMFYGFFLGTVFDGDREITYAGSATIICLLFASGMFWPIEGIHWAIRTQTKYFPIMMATESYRAVSMRGWGLDHPFIALSILANIGLVLFLLALFVLVSRKKRV